MGHPQIIFDSKSFQSVFSEVYAACENSEKWQNIFFFWLFKESHLGSVKVIFSMKNGVNFGVMNNIEWSRVMETGEPKIDNIATIQASTN